MVLKNHIAYRFLTDDDLAMEIIEATYPDEFDELLRTENLEEKGFPEKISSLYSTVNNKDQKTYYITNTILDKLDLLKIKKIHTEGIGDHFDWTFFKHLPDQKITFVFPNNSLLRLTISDNILHFFQLNFEYDKGNENHGQMGWVMFYVDRMTGEQCDHFKHIDVRSIEEFVYGLMAFFYLSDNEEIIINPGEKYGTRKMGKIINTFDDIPMVIVNNNWNVTSIRNEGFGVSGHAALRWTGPGRKTPKMVLIEPYRKNGYVRRAQKEQHV